MGSTEGTDTTGANGEGAAAEKPDPARAGLIAEAQKERAARQAAEAKLKAHEDAAAEAARKAAEEAGQHKALYDGLKPKYDEAVSKLTAAEKREADRIAAVTARNAERKQALPEHMRGLVPDGLNPDGETAQIEKLEALAKQAGTATFPAGTSAGAGAGGGKKPSIPADCIAQAQRLGRDPEAHLPSWLLTPSGKAWQAKQTTP